MGKTDSIKIISLNRKAKFQNLFYMIVLTVQSYLLINNNFLYGVSSDTCKTRASTSRWAEIAFFVLCLITSTMIERENERSEK